MMSESVSMVGETILFAAGRTWFSIATIFVLLCFFAVIYLIGRRSLWLAALVFCGAFFAMTFVSHRQVSHRRVSEIDVSGYPSSRHNSRHESSRSQASSVILEKGFNEPTPDNAQQIPVAWRLEVEEQFPADKYASQNAAAKASQH